MLYIAVGAVGLGLAVVGILLLVGGVDPGGWLLTSTGTVLTAIGLIGFGRAQRARPRVRITGGNTAEFNRLDHRIPQDRWGIPESSSITGVYVKVLKVENLSKVEARRVRIEITAARPSEGVTAFPIRLKWLDSGDEERDIAPRGWALVPIQRYVMTNEKQHMLGPIFLWHLGRVDFTVVAWGENTGREQRRFRLDWPEAGPYRMIAEIPPAGGRR